MTIENKYALKILWILTIILTIIFWILFNYKEKEINKCEVVKTNENLEIKNNVLDYGCSHKIDFIYFFNYIPFLLLIFSLLLSVILSIMAIIFYYKKDGNEKAKRYLKISWFLLLYTFLIFIMFSIISWLIRFYNPFY